MVAQGCLLLLCVEINAKAKMQRMSYNSLSNCKLSHPAFRTTYSGVSGIFEALDAALRVHDPNEGALLSKRSQVWILDVNREILQGTARGTGPVVRDVGVICFSGLLGFVRLRAVQCRALIFVKVVGAELDCTNGIFPQGNELWINWRHSVARFVSVGIAVYRDGILEFQALPLLHGFDKELRRGDIGPRWTGIVAADAVTVATRSVERLGFGAPGELDGHVVATRQTRQGEDPRDRGDNGRRDRPPAVREGAERS